MRSGIFCGRLQECQSVRRHGLAYSKSQLRVEIPWDIPSLVEKPSFPLSLKKH